MNIELAYQLLILIGASTLFATLFHYLKQPTIVGFILAGIIVGPFGLGLVGTLPGAHLLTEIGVIFLLFTIGLEFSFKRLAYLKKAFLGLGVSQVLVTMILVWAIFWLFFDFSWSKALFMGCVVSLSSTAMIMKLLEESREAASPYGTTTLAILLCQDLAVIPMMLALPLFAAGHELSSSLSWLIFGEWLLRFVGIALALWIGAKWVVPFLLEKVAKTQSRELFFFAILLLCFGVAFSIEHMGMSLSLGAFLAGVMISESAYGKQATADIVPLRDNFLGLFFASVGMLVDVTFVLNNILTIILLVLALIVIKVTVVFILARLNRYPTATALITGLMVFQVGEFSFILADLGANLNILTSFELQCLISVSVITMMMTPFIFKLAPRLALARGYKKFPAAGMKLISELVKKDVGKKVEEQLHYDTSPQPSEEQGHTIIIGYGVVGANLASGMKALGIPFAIIEQNYGVVQKLRKQGVNIHYGDASRKEILEETGINTAKLVVIAASGIESTRVIAEVIRKIRPDVKLIIRLQYSRQCDDLRTFPGAEMVVAENETTIELMAKALSVYGVPSDQIERCMHNTREELRGRTDNISDYIRGQLDLPAREALGSIRPVRVDPGSKAVNQSLSDLQLRNKTGAAAVAIYRKGEGTVIPRGDFVLQANDILHLIGDHEAFEKATELLATPSKPLPS